MASSASRTSRARSGIALALLPGDDQPDAELRELSTVPADAAHRLWRYLAEGGASNAAEFLRYAASLIGRPGQWREPAPLLRAGLYWPGREGVTLETLRAHWRDAAPVAAIVFYRALVQAANTAPVDALIEALQARGLNPLPLFASSLKDPQSAAILAGVLAEAPPDIVLNATGFAVSAPGETHRPGVLEGSDCPVLQVIFAGGEEAAWRRGTRGLDARDIAMNVALPEIDGRIITRAVSFKAASRRDPLTETDLVAYAPVPDRIAFVADLARNWVRLRRTPVAERRVALVLANYPQRDGRIGNGVGLDTPQATIEVLRALAAEGYRVGEMPRDGDALIAALRAGPTNSAEGRRRPAEESIACSDYAAFFATLPRAAQEQVEQRWGVVERDPAFRAGRLDCGSLAIAALRFGNVAVAIQPSRGYDIDPAPSYHAPDLAPPHGYLAFYAWLGLGLRAQAVVHMGKHGNLEWLPGKALALSAECFPEAALGPLPHLYPFIVNDPGEGTQAKRRAQAVIIDHLTPPLTRAESYGRLAELERLVDEYYAAAGSDPRRLALLSGEIVALLRATGLDRDCGIAEGTGDAQALGKLDAYLCELKEMQIRDGLHIFGRAPEGDQLTDLLVALARLPRGTLPAQASLIRALATDLALGFDPLAAALGEAWTGPRPAALAGGDPWRSAGDTVERLELLARRLVAGDAAPDPSWTRTRAVLDAIASETPPGGRGLRRGRDRGAAARPRRALRGAGPVRRADPRPARGAAHGPQLLFDRHPRRADAGRLAARLEIGAAAGRAPCAGAGELSAPARALRLGHVQHAHRRRRCGAGAGADGRAPAMGAENRPRHRLRDHAGEPARPAARRCHLARLGLLSRCLPQPHRAGRQRRARGGRARRARRDQPARRPRRRRPRGARSLRHRRRGGPAPRRLPRLRRQARRLWRGAAGADRRARLARRARPCRGLSRLGRLCLWRGRPRAKPSRRSFATASRGSKRWCRTRTIASTISSTATITISSRAALPSRCAISPALRRSSTTTTIRGRRILASARWRRRSAASSMPAWSIRNGSRA